MKIDEDLKEIIQPMLVIIGIVAVVILAIIAITTPIGIYLNQKYPEKHGYSVRLDDEQFERILNVLEAGKDGEK